LATNCLSFSAMKIQKVRLSWDAGIYPQVHTALQPGRPTMTLHRRKNLKFHIKLHFLLSRILY
jgi:hypothetical protein